MPSQGFLEKCPVYESQFTYKRIGFNPRQLLPKTAFINKDINNTPDQMGLHVRIYLKKMIVLYFDCAGNCYIFSFYKTNRKYKIRSTITVNTKDGLNIDKTRGYMLESINTRGSSEDDAIEAVARFCAVFEINARRET